MSVKEMEKVIENFKRELPALAKLQEQVIAQASQHGYLQAPDGHWGRVRSQDGKIKEHTALNVLLQMTGSLCMKYAAIRASHMMRQEGVALDENGHPAFLANVHDEVQMEVNEEEVLEISYVIPASQWKEEEKKEYHDSEGRMWSAPAITEGDAKGDGDVTVMRRYHRAGQILAEAMTWAGDFLKMRCPQAGEFKIGNNWYDTH